MYVWLSLVFLSFYLWLASKAKARYCLYRCWSLQIYWNSWIQNSFHSDARRWFEEYSDFSVILVSLPSSNLIILLILSFPMESIFFFFCNWKSFFILGFCIVYIPSWQGCSHWRLFWGRDYKTKCPRSRTFRVSVRKREACAPGTGAVGPTCRAGRAPRRGGPLWGPVGPNIWFLKTSWKYGVFLCGTCLKCKNYYMLPLIKKKKKMHGSNKTCPWPRLCPQMANLQPLF